MLKNFYPLAKAHKQAWVESYEEGDMPPTVIGIQQGKAQILVVANQVDKKLGLYALGILRKAFYINEAILITDAHTIIQQGKSEEEIKRLYDKYMNNPGSMQKACDEDGACAANELIDCLNLVHISPQGKFSMVALPYHYHGKKGGVNFQWRDDLMETMEDQDLVTPEESGQKSGVGGFIPVNMAAIMQEPILLEDPLTKELCERQGMDIKDPQVQAMITGKQQPVARALLLTQGFILFECVDFDGSYEDFASKMGSHYSLAKMEQLG